MPGYLLQHEFKNVYELEKNGRLSGDAEIHGKFKWKLRIINSIGHLWLSLVCERLSEDVDQVKTNFKLTLISENGNRWAKKFDGYCFEFNETGVHTKNEKFLEWEMMKTDFLVDGKIKVQAELGELDAVEAVVGDFTMKHVFENVKRMKPEGEMLSGKEYHLSQCWRLCIKRNTTSLGIYVCCELADQTEKLRADLVLALVSENGNRFAVKLKDAAFELKSSESYSHQGKFILDWTSIGDFLDDGKLSVEAKINVLENVIDVKTNLIEQTEEDKKMAEERELAKQKEEMIAYMESSLEELMSKLAEAVRPLE